MEAKRAQGFPDDEVLIGAPKDGWKILGNSVARTVSLALGLSLREAWLKNEPDKYQELASRSILQVVIPLKLAPFDALLGFEDDENIAPSDVVLKEISSNNDIKVPRVFEESSQTVTTSHVESVTLNGIHKGTESQQVKHRSSVRALARLEGSTGQQNDSSPADLPPSTVVGHELEHQPLAQKTMKRSRVSSTTSLSSSLTDQTNSNAVVTSSKRRKTSSCRAPSTLSRPVQDLNGYLDSTTDEGGLSEDLPRQSSSSLTQHPVKSRLRQAMANGRGHANGAALITPPDSSSHDMITTSNESDSRARVSALLSRRAWPDRSQGDRRPSTETYSSKLPTNPITNGQAAVGTPVVHQLKDRQQRSVVSLKDVLDDEPFMSVASSSTRGTSHKRKKEETPISISGNSNITGTSAVIPKKQTIISLLSDSDESESGDEVKEDKSAVKTAVKSIAKYIPADNSSFAPYAATHRYLNFDRQRRHGPMS